MDEKTLRLLVENGAINQIRIIGNGGLLHVEAVTPTGTHKATTQKGKLRSWSSMDTAAKWVRALGVGTAQIKMEGWQPGQKTING